MYDNRTGTALGSPHRPDSRLPRTLSPLELIAIVPGVKCSRKPRIGSMGASQGFPRAVIIHTTILPPVCPSQARVFHPFVPVQARAQSRPMHNPVPCAVQVRAQSSPVRTPVQCAVQARAQSRPVCSQIKETQASVYTHLASNGAWKEWSYCQKREKEGKYSFSEGWKPTHLFYWKDL